MGLSIFQYCHIIIIRYVKKTTYLVTTVKMYLIITFIGIIVLKFY